MMMMMWSVVFFSFVAFCGSNRDFFFSFLFFFFLVKKIRANERKVDDEKNYIVIVCTEERVKFMARITRDLLRRRAEHNDGIVRTLREVSLHRQNLEAIDACVQRDCRELRILLLHDNQIRKLGASSLSRRVSLYKYFWVSFVGL